MSFALQDIKRLLSNPASMVGAVVSVQGTLVRVATERGAATARTLDAVSVGDRVLIKNGMATRAPIAAQAYPV